MNTMYNKSESNKVHTIAQSKAIDTANSKKVSRMGYIGSHLAVAYMCDGSRHYYDFLAKKWHCDSEIQKAIEKAIEDFLK